MEKKNLLNQKYQYILLIEFHNAEVFELINYRHEQLLGMEPKKGVVVFFRNRAEFLIEYYDSGQTFDDC